MRVLVSVRKLAVALPILAVLGLLPVVPAQATGVSQIVLSCTTPAPESQTTNGCRSSELVTSPPIIVSGTLYIIGGFWIWCQNPNGGTPYGPDCSGSMYIAEINLGTGAVVYETTSIAGGAAAAGPTGLQVSFTSSDGDMSCTLNVPSSPTGGGTNTLGGLCDGFPISFTKSVVQVT
jgi:hypothetical protein